jgi:hypothetical protein
MGTNNAINNNIFGPNGGLNLPGFKLISAFQKGISIGTTDLYTAPAGKRAIVFPCYGANANTAATNVSMTPKIKTGGNYFFMGQTVSIAQGVAMTPPNKNGTFILEPGESASVVVATSAVNTFGYPIIEYDNTVALKTSRVTSIASGNNTIYTCPSNTLAFVLDINGQMAMGTQGGQLYYTNNSGGIVTINWFMVNSGGATGAGNNVSGSNVISNGTFNTAAGLVGLSMSAGDTIVISTNSATAGQCAWVNVLECPA